MKKKIHVLNLSDIKAKISDTEIDQWLSAIKDMWYDPILYKETLLESWINVFEQIMKDDWESIILFTSGGVSAIQYVEKLMIKQKIKNRKILIWYSDLQHIQSIFANYPLVDVWYWVTMRNIGDLTIDEKNSLTNFIEKDTTSIKIKIISWLYKLHWKIFGGHISIFLNTYDIFKFNLKNSILYFDFHGIDLDMILYLLDIIKIKWIFKKVKWVVLDKEINDNIINKIKSCWITNIYMLEKEQWLPLFKYVYIEWEKLTYLK